MYTPELNAALSSCCFPKCNLEKFKVFFSLETAIMSNKPYKEKKVYQRLLSIHVCV